MAFFPTREKSSASGRMKARMFVAFGWALLAALSMGCGSGDDRLADVDHEAVPQDPSWEQVFSIFQRECRPCHGPGGQEPKLETCEDVIANFEKSYEQIINRNAMPPGAWPRLTSEEKLIIERFGGDAPCL